MGNMKKLLASLLCVLSFQSFAIPVELNNAPVRSLFHGIQKQPESL
jgi:hypothetical protein